MCFAGWFQNGMCVNNTLLANKKLRPDKTYSTVILQLRLLLCNTEGNAFITNKGKVDP
jgi:hypothetical protein